MIVDLSKIDKTKMVEAAAQGMVNRRHQATENDTLPWDALSPMAKHHVRESVLPLVNLILSDIETQSLNTFEDDLKGLLDG